MNEMTLEGFLKLAYSDTGLDAEWMVIGVEGVGKKPEIIINPKENFAEKIEYYKNAYNYDLTLKANTRIRIIWYDFVKELKGLMVIS